MVKKFYSGTFNHAIRVVFYYKSVATGLKEMLFYRHFSEESGSLHQYKRKVVENIMEKKKSYHLLLISLVMLAGSIIFTIYARNTTYVESTVVGEQLSDIKVQIASIEAGTAKGDAEVLNTQKTELSNLKLELEKPYSYGLTALFIAIMLTIKGLYHAFIGKLPAQKSDIRRLTQAERVDEIATMISGSTITDAARKQAKILLA